MLRFLRSLISPQRPSSETIGGICPECGPSRILQIAGGLWDGWDAEGRPASGISLTGRCLGCGALLRVLAEDGQEAESLAWSPLGEEEVESLRWVVAGGHRHDV